MTPVEFCEKWCGKLTDEQKTIVEHKHSRREFIGVGRQPGSMQLMPLAYVDRSACVIDGEGKHRIASMEGRRRYAE